MGSNKKLYGYYPFGDEWLPIKVDSTGKLILSSPAVRARAYLSTEQIGIATNSYVKVLLNAESYDIGSNFANYKFTAPVTGYYFVSGAIQYYSVIADKNYFAVLRKNGNDIIMNAAQSSMNQYLSVLFSDVVYLLVTQYLELFALTYAGAVTGGITGYEYQTYLTINLLPI